MNTKRKVYNDMSTNLNITRKQIDPYEILANAIILQAVQDYRMLRSGKIPTVTEEQQLNMKQENVFKTIASQKQSVIKFFQSTWYADLTKLSGQVLLERLNSEPITRWKPASEYVEVNPDRLKEEIERRMLGVTMLYRITRVKGDYFRSILNGKVIIPLKRAMKIVNGLGIPEDEFILRKWSDKE